MKDCVCVFPTDVFRGGAVLGKHWYRVGSASFNRCELWDRASHLRKIE